MVSLYKRCLEDAGHEVTVFTLGDVDPAGDDPNVLRSPGIPLADTGYYFAFRYNREMQNRLRNMDILHCHHLVMSVDMAHRYSTCPIVYTNHTRYDLYTNTYTPLSQPAADTIMRQIWPQYTDFCDVVITPSESMRRVMLDFGVRQPIKVIENGVDIEHFRQVETAVSRAQLGVPADAFLLVYVGRLAPEKNLALLLDQFAIARDLMPSLHLLIIGSGTLATDLRLQADALSLGSAVHFVGKIAPERIAGYLAAADAFTTASVSEVHPVTVIEAMAAGLPVVAPVGPGIVETVESGRSGLLTRYPDGGLAAAMVVIASNEAQRTAMGLAAQAASTRYDINKTVDQTLALYDELRRKRPDLKRRDEHGRRYRTWPDNFKPIVEQLGRLLRPPDDVFRLTRFNGERLRGLPSQRRSQGLGDEETGGEEL